MSLVSAIKLIRTDTTLDLSQKAEKGMLDRGSPPSGAWGTQVHGSLAVMGPTEDKRAHSALQTRLP